MEHGGREARLLSRSGGILKTWMAEPPGRLAFAKLVKRPSTLGGGTLVIIGFSQAYDNPHANSLCAFDADDPNTLLWERHLKDDEPLPDPHERGYEGADFNLEHCRVFDVFPEQEGTEPADELIVRFGCAWSQRVLRIYDLTGRLLYQVWQDGGIADFYWMSEPGLLICLGQDEKLKTDPRYAKLKTPLAPYIFAIRPKRGHIAHHYVRTEPGDGPLDPVWRKYLMPIDALDHVFSNSLGPPAGRYPPDRHVAVHIGPIEDAIREVAVTLDQHGNEVGVRVVTDAYRDNQRLHPAGDPERLPDPETGFYFAELPPIGAEPGSEPMRD